MSTKDISQFARLYCLELRNHDWAHPVKRFISFKASTTSLLGEIMRKLWRLPTAAGIIVAIIACYSINIAEADEFSDQNSSVCDRNLKVVDKKICGKYLCFCGGEASSFAGTANSEEDCKTLCPPTQTSSSYPLEIANSDGSYTPNCDKLDNDPALSTKAPGGYACLQPCRVVRTGPTGLYDGWGTGCCTVKTIWTCEEPPSQRR